MKLLSKLRAATRAFANSIENPSSPLSWDALVQAIDAWRGGATDAGMQVDEQTALTYTAVWRAVLAVSEPISTVPLNVYRRKGNSRELAVDSPLYRLLHTQPNPQMTSAVYRLCMQAQAMLWGACYAEIQWDGAGRPVALWPLLSQYVTPKRVDGRLVYEYKVNNSTREIQPEDIIAVTYFTLDGITPLSPIAAHRQAIGLGLAAQRFGAQFFGNGAHPAGVLVSDKALTTTQQTELQAAWDRQYGGGNNRGTAVLHGGLKWQQITINPEDAQFLETRKFQVQEIARIFGVPPHMLQDLERSTNNNIEHQSIEFVRDTVRPWAVRHEAEYNAKLTPKNGSLYVEHNLDGLLRGDFISRQQGLEIQRRNGIINGNQWAALENMNEYPGGDKYIVQGQYVELQSIGDVPATSGTSMPTKNGKADSKAIARPVLRDAIGRITSRDKRDASFAARTLMPALSVLALSSGFPESSLPELEPLLSDYARAAGARAANWNYDDVETITDAELTRAHGAIAELAKDLSE